ncbi:MAG: amidohydrolase [Akkermansiaceae bacterium]|nr:amidohydrolase [Akkermansiaceae bacterium]
MIPILDTHLHLIYQDDFSYDWCAGIPALNKNFHLHDYQKLVEGRGVAASIFMEVDVAEGEIAAEARFFTELAKADDNPLTAVIASCRPERDDFEQQLETTLTDSVCGLRRVLHTMPDELSQSSLFRDNIRTLAARGLPFDLCFLERQLALAYDLAAACPENRFVLNHCGVPTIAAENFDAWKQDLSRLATLPNVSCKVSGVIAYCPDPEQATLDTLRPWLETSVEAFGTDRIVFGSDWPVCNLTKGLPAWLDIARGFFSSFSDDEQHAVFHRNAEAIYSIPAL